MEVIRNIDSIRKIPDGVVTVGTFDGIHLAHRAIISKLVAIAESKKTKSTVVTFEPHPRLVVGQKDGKDVELLSTVEEKVQLLEGLGIDRLIIIPFTREFSHTPPDVFLKDVLCERIGLQKLIIGYDHGFGKNRAGGIELLIQSGEKCGFTVEVEEPISNELGIVSSSLVRAFLKKGDVLSASICLKRPYSLTGKVVKGDGRGRKLNFPTANIEVNHPNKSVPAPGVYAVRARVQRRWHNGVMNIGVRPTFGINSVSLEVHIFDFVESIYGNEITIEFLRQIRKEKKFENADALVSQIKKDVLVAKEYLNNVDKKKTLES